MERLVKLVKVLVRHGVDFVTIGKLGAEMLGVAVATEDADVAVKRSAVNRERLMNALDDLQARYRMFDGTGGNLVDTQRPEMLLGSDIWGFITPPSDPWMCY